MSTLPAAAGPAPTVPAAARQSASKPAPQGDAAAFLLVLFAAVDATSLPVAAHPQGGQPTAESVADDQDGQMAEGGAATDGLTPWLGLTAQAGAVHAPAAPAIAAGSWLAGRATSRSIGADGVPGTATDRGAVAPRADVAVATAMADIANRADVADVADLADVADGADMADAAAAPVASVESPGSRASAMVREGEVPATAPAAGSASLGDTGARPATAGRAAGGTLVEPEAVGATTAGAAAGARIRTEPSLRAEQPLPVQAMVAQVGDGTPASAAAVQDTASTSAPAATASALLDRVLEAVEQLENRPPPRRMVVEIGDLRLTVSLTGDQVGLAVSGGRSGAELSPEWQRDLGAALAAKGFSLGAGDRQESANGDPADRSRDESGGRSPDRSQERPGRAGRPGPTRHRAETAGWQL